MTQAHSIAARHHANRPSQAVRAPVAQTITIATRKRIEDAIERLMLLLDAIDDDSDLEPSLGWPDPFSWWRFSDEIGGNDDREDEFSAT